MDQIEEIRSKVDIVQLVSEYVPLKKAGRNWRATCPFHAEKTPSFMVSPELGIFKCFGCGRGGSIFQFLMEFEKMDFGEALRFLAKRAGVKLVSYRPAGEEAEKEKLFQINHLASEFYHYLLLNHRVGQPALRYILGRGITRESITVFGIGYAPNLWDGLRRYLVGRKGYQPEDLERAGLAGGGRESHDQFRDRLMFPLKDHRGNVRGFAGRILPSGDREAPKYINTPETLVYHKSDLLYGLSVAKEAIKKEDAAVVVEGELDAISSYQAGVQNVVAIKGSALTEGQAGLLKRFCQKIILALDADLAGDMAARRGVEIADNAGFEVRVASLGSFKDPDEAAQKDAGLFKKQLAEAVPVFDFLITSAFSRFPQGTAEAKRKIGQELVPVLVKISDEIVKAHYVKELAARLGIAEEAVWEQIKKTQNSKLKIQNSTSEENQSAKMPKSRREVLEEYLLAILFQAEELKILQKRELRNLLATPAFLRILETLDNFTEEKKKFGPKGFAKELPEELKEIFSNLYLFDLGDLLRDEEKKDREIEKTKRDLADLVLREKLAELSRLIKGLEEEGKEEELGKLQEEFRRLSQKLA
ncbi:DNA primase [Candidatus Shapirobacteria bacterium]|nr:DNA primase [Candidatus Shapirobacteria bacterium]